MQRRKMEDDVGFSRESARSRAAQAMTFASQHVGATIGSQQAQQVSNKADKASTIHGITEAAHLRHPVTVLPRSHPKDNCALPVWVRNELVARQSGYLDDLGDRLAPDNHQPDSRMKLWYRNRASGPPGAAQ